jgi:hypothetical protein
MCEHKNVKNQGSLKFCLDCGEILDASTYKLWMVYAESECGPDYYLTNFNPKKPLDKSPQGKGETPPEDDV